MFVDHVAIAKMQAEFMAANSLTPEEVASFKLKDIPKKTTYLLHSLNEKILQDKIDKTTDEVVKSDLQKQTKQEPCNQRRNL